ncbi:MAG TPA: type III pantothenate kinase, partial [Candidatus Obscuribacterales bacterium]
MAAAMAAVQDIWLGLVVGNTRLHWGLFHGDTLTGGWHTPHLPPATVTALWQQQFAPAAWGAAAAAIPPLPPGVPLPLWVASVVPSQTALWQAYPDFHAITLGDLPLGNLYPTLGIDRALNLVGAGDRYGWPILVIDAGTALTFTAGTAQGLIGGAILPGFAA